jgi:hypothetical protein
MVLSRSSSSGKTNSSCGYFCRRKRFLIFLLWSSSIIIFIVLQLRLIKFDNNNSSHNNSKMMMMHHQQSRTGKTHDRIRTRTKRSEENIVFTSILKEEKVRWKRRMNGIIIPNSIPIPYSIEIETADNNERHKSNIVEEEEKEVEGEKIPTIPKNPSIPIILLVGGSDGSGTRGMVDILKNEFYVDFIIEDPTTLDVHGQIMYDKKGWPELVLQVLYITNGSVDYEFPNTNGNTAGNTSTLFSFQKQQDIKKNIIKLLEYIQRRYIIEKERGLKMAVKKAFQDHIMNMNNKSNNATTNIANIANSNDRRTILSRTISIPTPSIPSSLPNITTNNNGSSTLIQNTTTTTATIQIPLPYEASKVSYAFKAPVTMLLLPIFTSIIDTIFIENNNNNEDEDKDKSLLYQYPKVKFIHVVRE